MIFFQLQDFIFKIVKYYREIISLQVIYNHLISGLCIPKQFFLAQMVTS